MVLVGIAAFPIVLLAVAYARPAPVAAAIDATPPAKRHVMPVDQLRARRIAWEYGVLHIEEIALAGRRWEIAGRDDRNDAISLEIDAKTGEVSR